MKVLALTSQKGGSGKTTLAGHLAVAAEMSGAGPVAVIDTDPQGSLTDWWNERQASTPSFLSASITTLSHDLERAHDLGFQLVVIDTPPAISASIETLVFIINAANPRARITGEAAVVLSQHGTVAPVTIHQRTDFASSMIDGRTVMELPRSERSCDEITRLWEYVQSRFQRHASPTVMPDSFTRLAGKTTHQPPHWTDAR